MYFQSIKHINRSKGSLQSLICLPWSVPYDVDIEKRQNKKKETLGTASLSLSLSLFLSLSLLFLSFDKQTSLLTGSRLFSFRPFRGRSVSVPPNQLLLQQFGGKRACKSAVSWGMLYIRNDGVTARNCQRANNSPRQKRLLFALRHPLISTWCYYCNRNVTGVTIEQGKAM